MNWAEFGVNEIEICCLFYKKFQTVCMRAKAASPSQRWQ